ncbi:hypothetical protein AOLI_G00287570 [Acnodon oligacanthus]
MHSFKELRCRLVRNTLTNMVSIVRATTTEVMYPSKNDVQAMAKRLVEYYPVLRENSVNCKHTWVMDELRCILDRSNPDFISDLKTSWESFYGKAQFYGVFKKLLGPSTTQDKVTRSIAMMKALPEMFPSPVAPPKNLGHASEAMVHILEPTENPNTYLQRRPVFSPVLIICDSSCMLAIGSTPVITFPKENIDTAVLYLLAYYYTFHLTYPKCIATLLSVLQSEVQQDAIHDSYATSSYKKALSEWKKFIGE